MPAERAYVPNMPPLMTANDLLHVNIPGKQVELVRGVLVVREPPGFQHGALMARLGAMLIQHVDAHDLGVDVLYEHRAETRHERAMLKAWRLTHYQNST